jgi:glutaredoxin
MIVVYGRDDCPWCEQAIGIIKGFNHKDYKYLKLDRDITLEDFQKKYPDAESVPLIELDGAYLGGYEELCGYMVETYGGGLDTIL